MRRRSASSAMYIAHFTAEMLLQVPLFPIRAEACSFSRERERGVDTQKASCVCFFKMVFFLIVIFHIKVALV